MNITPINYITYSRKTNLTHRKQTTSLDNPSFRANADLSVLIKKTVYGCCDFENVCCIRKHLKSDPDSVVRHFQQAGSWHISNHGANNHAFKWLNLIFMDYPEELYKVAAQKFPNLPRIRLAETAHSQYLAWQNIPKLDFNNIIDFLAIIQKKYDLIEDFSPNLPVWIRCNYKNELKYGKFESSDEFLKLKSEYLKYEQQQIKDTEAKKSRELPKKERQTKKIKAQQTLQQIKSHTITQPAKVIPNFITDEQNIRCMMFELKNSNTLGSDELLRFADVIQTPENKNDYNEVIELLKKSKNIDYNVKDEMDITFVEKVLNSENLALLEVIKDKELEYDPMLDYAFKNIQNEEFKIKAQELNIKFPQVEEAIKLSSQDGLDILDEMIQSPAFTKKTGEVMAKLARKSKPEFTAYFYSRYSNKLPLATQNLIPYYMRLAQLNERDRRFEQAEIINNRNYLERFLGNTDDEPIMGWR